MTLEAVAFDAARLCEDIVRLQGVRARDKGVEPRLEASAKSFPVLGDPLRLRRSLVNLVDNAFKFTERGEVVLGLDAARPDPVGTRSGSGSACGIVESGYPPRNARGSSSISSRRTRPPPESMGAQDWASRSAGSRWS
jgi:hypothetical protein